MSQLSYKLLGGEHMVYPSHPGLNTWIIYEKYKNDPREAWKTTEHGWAQANGDIDIDGAGCHVGYAVQLFRKVCLGEMTPEEAVAEGHRYWVQGKAGGHMDSVVPGLEQAMKFQSKVLAALTLVHGKYKVTI